MSLSVAISVTFLPTYVRPHAKNPVVTFDGNLSFNRQVNSVVRSSFFQLSKKNSHFLSPSDLERVIHALISARLDYCNSLYLGIYQATISRLQLIQNTAVQLLTRCKKNDHRPYIWLPIHLRINFRIPLIVYRYLHDLAPAYISEVLSHYWTTRPLRSSQCGMLTVPRSWNSLLETIRQAKFVDAFKIHPKTHFYYVAFSHI